MEPTDKIQCELHYAESVLQNKVIYFFTVAKAFAKEACHVSYERGEFQLSDMLLSSVNPSGIPTTE